MIKLEIFNTMSLWDELRFWRLGLLLYHWLSWLCFTGGHLPVLW